MNVLKIDADDFMDNYSIKNLLELKVNNVENLYTWKYNNSTIEIYGSLDSNKGIVNKHKLPPNGISNILDIESNKINLYGDIFIIKLINGKLQNYSIGEYGEFFSYLTEYYDYDNDNDNDNDNDYNSDDNDSNNSIEINIDKKLNIKKKIYHKFEKKNKPPTIEYELETDENIY